MASGSCGFRHSKVSELISGSKSTPAPTGAFGWLFRGCAPGDERKTSARARATLGFSATFSTIGPAIVQAGEAKEWNKRVFLSVCRWSCLALGRWLCLWGKLRVGVGGPTDDLGLTPNTGAQRRAIICRSHARAKIPVSHRPSFLRSQVITALQFEELQDRPIDPPQHHCDCFSAPLAEGGRRAGRRRGQCVSGWDDVCIMR